MLGQDLAAQVDERDAGLFDEDVHFLLGMRVGDLERDAVEGDRAVVVHHPCSFTGLDDPLPGELPGTLLAVPTDSMIRLGSNDRPGRPAPAQSRPRLGVV